VSLDRCVAAERRVSASPRDRQAPLADRPVDALLEILAGMATARRSLAETMEAWAAALSQRGVTHSQLAEAHGVPEQDLRP
jgi:hypothetical protein